MDIAPIKILIVTICILASGMIPADLFEYSRRAVLVDMDVWRWLTAHIVHYDMTHSLLNAVATLLAAVLFSPVLHLAQVMWCIGLGVTAINLGLWLDSSVGYYAGASGILYGIYTLGALHALGNRKYLLGLTILLMLAAKLLGPYPEIEASLPERTYITLSMAHWLGCLAGLSVYGVTRFRSFFT